MAAACIVVLLLGLALFFLLHAQAGRAAAEKRAELPAASPARAEERAATPTPPPATQIPTPPLRAGSPARTLYQGALRVSDEQAQGKVSITYVNNSPDTLYALYFHLYPNAASPGSMAVSAVSLEGMRAYYRLSKEDTLLCVPLINELRPGEAARVYVEFSIALPKTGIGSVPSPNQGRPLMNLFPLSALYENGWKTEATPGEVDYTPLADWRVLLETEGLPMLLGGNIQPLEDGQYLCTGSFTEWEMWLETAS